MISLQCISNHEYIFSIFPFSIIIRFTLFGTLFGISKIEKLPKLACLVTINYFELAKSYFLSNISWPNDLANSNDLNFNKIIVDLAQFKVIQNNTKCTLASN